MEMTSTNPAKLRESGISHQMNIKCALAQLTAIRSFRDKYKILTKYMNG